MEKSWEQLEAWCLNCDRCPLFNTRTNVVIGRGGKMADIMFIGEGPGEQEDLQGKPFVGPAGQLLDKMMEAAELSEDAVYIANIVKCRPPRNRDPKEEEQAACINYLRYQVALVQPKIIVCLGRIAAQAIIDKNYKITKQHGQWIEKKGILITATYHPSALLRDETKKRPAWEDFKSIRDRHRELGNNSL